MFATPLRAKEQASLTQWLLCKDTAKFWMPVTGSTPSSTPPRLRRSSTASSPIKRRLQKMISSSPSPALILTRPGARMGSRLSSSRLLVGTLQAPFPGPHLTRHHRLARITVRIFSEPSTLEASISIKSRNVRSFSIDQALLASRFSVRPTTLTVDSRPPAALLPSASAQTFYLHPSTPRIAPSTSSSRPRRYGPLLAILSSPSPLQIVVGTTGSIETERHLHSIATRIAHDAYVYGKVNSVILRDSDVVQEVAPGNVVLLGDSFTNSAVKRFSKEWPVPGVWAILSRPQPALMFH